MIPLRSEFLFTRCLREKRPRLGAQGIDHAQRGSGTRRPLMKLLEDLASSREGHHRA